MANKANMNHYHALLKAVGDTYEEEWEAILSGDEQARKDGKVPLIGHPNKTLWARGRVKNLVKERVFEVFNKHRDVAIHPFNKVPIGFGGNLCVGFRGIKTSGEGDMLLMNPGEEEARYKRTNFWNGWGDFHEVLIDDIITCFVGPEAKISVVYPYTSGKIGWKGSRSKECHYDGYNIWFKTPNFEFAAQYMSVLNL